MQITENIMQNTIFWKLSSDFEVKCAQIFQANLFSTCEFGEPGVQYGLHFYSGA